MVVLIILLLLNIVFFAINVYLVMQLNNFLDALEDTYTDMAMLLNKFKEV